MPAFFMRRTPRLVFAALTSAFLFLVSALPAWAAESMTLTFVRHGQSQANADDRIDTSVPGPDITALGQQQAEDIAAALAGNAYDGIYASNMVRTQQTAAPLAGQLGQDIIVLPGLREISAGIFEGSPESSGFGRLGYVLAPAAWTLGARFVPVLGAADGNAFDARVDDAIQTIYDNGDVNGDAEVNAVAFSHGATIMFWVMMNVDNPDLGLLLSHQLGNTGVVVVTGNPEDGWLLEEWDGVAVAAEPSLPTKLFVDVRNLVTAPQTALYNIGQAFASGDIAALANAVRDGVVDVVRAVVEFVPNVVRDIVDSVGGSTAGTVDEPVDTVHEPVNINAARNAAAPATEPDEPEMATLLTKTEKSHRSTDLTDGNKFRPGDTTERTATDDAGEQESTPKDDDDLDGVVTTLPDRPDPTAAPDPTDVPTDVDNDPADGDDPDASADADAGADSGSEQEAA